MRPARQETCRHPSSYASPVGRRVGPARDRPGSPIAWANAAWCTGERSYAALVMVPPAWLSTITGVSNQLISGSEP